MHLFQIMNQLFQILNTVDIMQRRWRDQIKPRHGKPSLRDRLIHLHPHQLPTLPRLGTLAHLYLNFIPRHQILGRHSEPARGNLLHRSPDSVRKIVRILPALPGITPPANLPHRQKNITLRLRTNRPERHRSGPKRSQNSLHRLRLLQRDHIPRVHRLKKMPQRHRLTLCAQFQKRIKQRHIRQIHPFFPRQIMNQFRPCHPHRMFLPHFSTGMIFVQVTFYRVDGFSRRTLLHGLLMSCKCPGRNLFHFQPAHRTLDARKVVVNNTRTEPQRREQFGTLIASNHRNTRLGHHFQQPAVQRPQQVSLPGLRIHPCERPVVTIPHSIQSEPRTHRLCTKPNQGGSMMCTLHLPGIHHHRGIQL